MVSPCPDDISATRFGRETLQIANRLSELEVMSAWLADLSSRLGLSARAAFRLELVLAEAVTNIIENAYTDGSNHEIAICIEPMAALVKVQIRDDGLPFNPLAYPAVVRPKNLEEATVGGLGIHLIRNYAQECCYQRQGHENLFTIVMNCGD